MYTSCYITYCYILLLIPSNKNIFRRRKYFLYIQTDKSIMCVRRNQGGRKMETFLIISILTVIVVFFVSFMLRKSFPNRSFDITFGLIIIIICLICFLITLFFIGGFEGMAYGFLCFFILIGTVVGMLLHQIVKLLRDI